MRGDKRQVRRRKNPLLFLTACITPHPSLATRHFSLSSHTVKTTKVNVPTGSKINGEIPSPKPLRQPAFLASAILLLILVCWTYSNHFENPFEFDDAHTIVNNTAIRHLKNIPDFFTDTTSSSTLPANRAYRPGLTALNAIDYAIQNRMNELVRKDSLGKAARFQKMFCPLWMAKVKAGTAETINPFWYHVSIFLTYLFLGFLFFHFLHYIFRKTFPEIKYAHWAALIGTGWFMVHTANAETINYIISRDDSFSTMMVIFAFVIYFFSEVSRKYLLFLIPIFLGYFVKEPTVMFAPLLLVFLWLFGDLDKNRTRLYLQVGVSFALAGFLFLLSKEMTPKHHTYGGGDWSTYIFTQAFVIEHYFNSFLLPANLSADTDWTLVNSPFDDRVVAGFFFIVAMLVVAWKCSKRKETKPIAFGILWFFIALAPTSIFPLSEVLNDHRPFFAYVGLIIAFVTGGILLFNRFMETEKKNIAKIAFPAFAVVILFSHAYGAHHRNQVWSSGESLWKDVTEKSPGNGRGWMNYGLSLMGRTSKDTAYIRQSMDSAIICLNRALSIYPNYSYANINMGLAQSKIGNDRGAEAYYTKAVLVDPYNPECYYYYGLYLLKMNRGDEAKTILNKGLAISPAHEGINLILASLNANNLVSPLDAARNLAKQNPTADNYLNLSLQLYNAGLFSESAQAAEQCVRIKPDYVLGYNNICAAFNKIGEWDSAVAAGKKAVDLDPKNQLSQNNFAFALQSKNHFDQLEADAKKNPTYNAWINLSLEWYNASNFKKSMVAAEEATMINPNDVIGWNNICAAANKIGDWDRAIVAGEKALKINPNYEQAKNNLAVAQQGKKGVK